MSIIDQDEATPWTDEALAGLPAITAPSIHRLLEWGRVDPEPPKPPDSSGQPPEFTQAPSRPTLEGRSPNALAS